MPRGTMEPPVVNPQGKAFQLDLENLKMNFPGPKCLNLLWANVMRVFHVSLGYVEGEGHGGAGDGLLPQPLQPHEVPLLPACRIRMQ